MEEAMHFEEPILEASENDIISGRGAATNLHPGNRRFRDLCFKRKPEFEAASHAAKRRIAGEIVAATKATGARFLKRKVDKGPWYEMSDEKCLHKACQVMRDYQRPDRLALRQASASARKRARLHGHVGNHDEFVEDSTSVWQKLGRAIGLGGERAEVPQAPLAPIIENPYGVHDHDVLSGRGALINGHVGNTAFRGLCLERKTQFDAGNYSEKRALATEVVNIIRNQNPPGRFLKRATRADGGTGEHDVVATEGEWVELTDEKAVHKACQVMRDIARPDRVGGRKKSKRDGDEPEMKDSMTILAETTAEASAVEEAVAATEEALDKALDSVPRKEDIVAEAQV